MKKEISFKKYKLTALMNEENKELPLVLIPGMSEDAEEIYKQTWDNNGKETATLLFADGIDWNRQLSPWPADKVFKGGEDFGGEADDFLLELLAMLKAATEEWELSPKVSYIAGYSLSGLFAVYSLYRCDVFSGAACVSGSMWYPDFIKFMKVKSPLKTPHRMYFSLGDKESKTQNPRLASVLECSERAAELMKSICQQTIFELNPGNHFADNTARIAKGINYLTDIKK